MHSSKPFRTSAQFYQINVSQTKQASEDHTNFQLDTLFMESQTTLSPSTLVENMNSHIHLDQALSLEPSQIQCVIEVYFIDIL